MKEFINKIIRKYSFLSSLFKIKIYNIFVLKKPKDFKKIPIIINNFNQLTYLKELILFLEKNGYVNIIVIDNASTYPPLLAYYKQDYKYLLYQLDRNFGHLSLWESGLISEYINDYFVFTDSDVLFTEECPENFLKHFWNLMQKYPHAYKIGPSLKIDDLPNHFKNKEEVISWESKFWKDEIEPNVFIAHIDTTFALYRPFILPEFSRSLKMNHLRVAGKYSARHQPWYVDQAKLSREASYYLNSIEEVHTHWAKKMK